MKRTITRRESWTPTGSLNGFTLEGLREILSRCPQSIQPTRMSTKSKEELLGIIRSGLGNSAINPLMRDAIDVDGPEVAALAEDAWRSLRIRSAGAIADRLHPNLVSAYRHHRAASLAAYRPIAPHFLMSHDGANASVAIMKARLDMSQGKKRYTGAPTYYPAVSWREPKEGRYPFAPRERLGGLNSTDLRSAGLRLVGYVESESSNLTDDVTGGWYDNPHGESFKDGTGIITGVVYQLPSRKGKSRLVPGWIQGGTDCGPTIDFAHMVEVKADSYSDLTHEARQTARDADYMAQMAAEEERAYQEALGAGVEYQELGDDIIASRRSCLALLKEFRHARGERLEGQEFESICRVVRDSVKSYIRDIGKARLRRAELLEQFAGNPAFEETC